MDRADAIKNVVNAVDNFKTDEGDFRSKDDEGLRKAIHELYEYAQDNRDSSVMKDGILAAQAEAKSLGLPDVSISFTESNGQIDKVKRDWKAFGGAMSGSAEEFSEFGSSLQYAMKQMNIVYQMGRVNAAADNTNKK